MEPKPTTASRRLGLPWGDGRTRARRALSNGLGLLHVVPDFVIIGAARAGTTSMLNHLRSHPGILYVPKDELHFFDSNRQWWRGPGVYRRTFPTRWARRIALARGRGPALSGENSPYYLAHPAAPARVRAVMPEVRLIALLRDPTDRAVSHWGWNVILGVEERSFEAVVEAELAEHAAEEDLAEPASGSTWRRSRYLARGLYQPQLERWRREFPGDQLLMLVSEAYYADPEAALRRVWTHLGLPPRPLADVSRNARSTAAARKSRSELPAIDPAVLERVRAWYRPHNQALGAYLGEPLPWG